MIFGMLSLPDRPQWKLERQLTQMVSYSWMFTIWIEVTVFPDSDMWSSLPGSASCPELALVSLLFSVTHLGSAVRCGCRGEDRVEAVAAGQLCPVRRLADCRRGCLQPPEPLPCLHYINNSS